MPSPNRFLTTHVGSVPRQEELMQIMFAREDGIPLDLAAVEQTVTEAVEDVVARQLKAGVDFINDGEMSKPSYATYIKDRLNGFGGTGNSFLFQDIEAYPNTKARVFADPGRKHRKTPACNGPISVLDMEAPKRDAARLKAIPASFHPSRCMARPSAPSFQWKRCRFVAVTGKRPLLKGRDGCAC